MDRIRIGWGRRDVSMEGPLSIAGQMYIRISEGIMDPLYVTALCMDGGEGMDAVIFLSADTATVYEGLLQPILDAVKRKDPSVPTDAIIFNATHTHAAPDLEDTGDTTPDGMPYISGTVYKAFFVEKCAEAVCEAWQNRSFGGMGYGYGFAVAAHSRRVVYFEEEMKAYNAQRPRDFMTPRGYAVMYGRTNDELFSHYEAGADHFLNLLFTFDDRDKLTGIVVNVPCPSQCGGGLYKLSADYWHNVRRLVAEEFGEDVFVLPQCAAAGDLSPQILHYTKAEARRIGLKYDLPYDVTKRSQRDQYENWVEGNRREIAGRIVDGIKDVYSWAKKEIFTQVPVRHSRQVMALQRRAITEEEKRWCEENLELLEAGKPQESDMTPEEYRIAYSRHESAVERNKTGIANYHDVNAKPNMDMVAHLVQVGDVAFATMRFELYQDFMHRLQARSPFMQTFVVQLCGDEGGNYLATRRGAAGRGYSASMFCNRVSADGGHQWVENCLRTLTEMKNCEMH